MPKTKKSELELRREFTAEIGGALAEARDYARRKFEDAATPAICLEIYNLLWTDGEQDEDALETFERANTLSKEKTPRGVIETYHSLVNQEAFAYLNEEGEDSELNDAIMLAHDLFGEDACTVDVIVEVHAEAVGAFYNDDDEDEE